MPHKTNPWTFESAEGYAQISNALIRGAEEGLCVSRMERDLSDHPWERMYGEMFGYSIIAMNRISKGLENIVANKEKCIEDLEKNPQILTEAIQLAGRMTGVTNLYDKMKELTKGAKEITLGDLRAVVLQTITDPDMLAKLMDLTPRNYVGLAPQLANEACGRYLCFKSKLNERIAACK